MMVAFIALVFCSKYIFVVKHQGNNAIETTYTIFREPQLTHCYGSSIYLQDKSMNYDNE